MLLWHKSADNNRHPIIDAERKRGRKKGWHEKESKIKRKDERENDGEDGGGEGKEREWPTAAAPTSGLINLMVSVDGEGLNEDGERGGRGGDAFPSNRSTKN